MKHIKKKVIKNKYILLLFVIFTIVLTGCNNQKPINNTDNNISHDQGESIEPKTKEYYESFRQKCGDDGCCLSSVDSAEAKNSLLFESNQGGMDIDADCPDGYELNMNRCITSYIWCEKKVSEKEASNLTPATLKCKNLDIGQCRNETQCIQLGTEIEFWGVDENGEPFNKLGFIPEKCVTSVLKYSSCEYIVAHNIQRKTASFPNECRCCNEITKGCALELCPVE